MRALFFSFFFLLFLNCLHAQEVFMRETVPNITVAWQFLGRDASLRVWDIEIDHNGVPVISHAKGVNRFYGGKLTDVSKSKGASSGSFFSMYRDNYDRLWLAGHSSLQFIEGDSIYRYPLPDSINKRFRFQLESFHKDASGTVHLGLKGWGYYKVYSDGTVEEVLGKSSGISGAVVTHLADGTPFYFIIVQAGYPENMSVYYMTDSKELKKIGESSEKKSVYESSLVEHDGGILSLSIGVNDIFQLKADSLIRHVVFDFAVIKLFVDSRNTLWIGTIDGGLFEALDDSLQHFRNYSVDGASAVVAEDKEGGLWIKSEGVSFGRIAQPAIPHLSERTGFEQFVMIQRIDGTADSLLCLAYSYGIFMLHGDSIREIPLPQLTHAPGQPGHDVFQITSCYNSVRHEYWVGFFGMVTRLEENGWKEIRLNPDLFKDTIVISLHARSDGVMMGTTRRELFLVQEDEIVPVTKGGAHRIYDFAIEPSGKIWVACKDGLWILENGQLVRPLEEMPEELKQTQYLIKFCQGSVWVQSVQQSLIRFNGSELEVIRGKDGEEVWAGNMAVGPNGYLWAGDNRQTGSVLRLSFDGEKTDVQRFRFDDAAGKKVSRQGLVVTKEKIFVGSAAGLYIADHEMLTKEFDPVETVLTQIRINHDPVKIAERYQLEHNENFINVEYSALSFRRKEIKSRYRMLGLDTSWFDSNYQGEQFTNLFPGEYRFQIQSRVKSEPWGETKEVVFLIAKPYWATSWFRILIALLSLFLLYGAFQFRARQVRNREQYKSKVALEMARLELKAIKAQLNPHFIFNSITSVMYYLSKNEPDNAENYLHRFSKLIRSVLDNSEKSTVPLSEELALLRHYVALESERFQGGGIQFDVTFKHIEPDDLQIPPALFQPYIENAIWHGLQYKEGARRILVHGEREGDYLKMTVEDNGIGREAAAKRGTGRKEQRSYGMMIASRRIEALNLHEVKEVVTEDLKDEAGHAIGTKITFYLPLLTENTSIDYRVSNKRQA